MDQNIEVNEIKAILEKAKKGIFTLSALMNNPTVKKALICIKVVIMFGKYMQIIFIRCINNSFSIQS